MTHRYYASGRALVGKLKTIFKYAAPSTVMILFQSDFLQMYPVTVHIIVIDVYFCVDGRESNFGGSGPCRNRTSNIRCLESLCRVVSERPVTQRLVVERKGLKLTWIDLGGMLQHVMGQFDLVVFNVILCTCIKMGYSS